MLYVQSPSSWRALQSAVGNKRTVEQARILQRERRVEGGEGRDRLVRLAVGLQIEAYPVCRQLVDAKVSEASRLEQGWQQTKQIVVRVQQCAP